MNDTELTTRDVVQQIDRRLTLIETDVGEMREQFGAKLDSVFNHSGCCVEVAPASA